MSMGAQELSVPDFLKKYTAVPNVFIDELFAMMQESTGPFDAVLDLDVVARWLSCKKFTLMKTLHKTYKRDIDYTEVKAPPPQRTHRGNNNYKRVMLTPDCFKHLCMQSRSRRAQEVRMYFIEVERVLLHYRNDLVKGLRQRVGSLERNQQPRRATRAGFIYVFRASDRASNVYKLGRALTWRRIKDHESSHADDIDVLFVYETSDVKAVETCAKAFLRDRQYRKFKEIYQADIDMIKGIVQKCSGIDRIKASYTKHGRLDESMHGGALFMGVASSDV